MTAKNNSEREQQSYWFELGRKEGIKETKNQLRELLGVDDLITQIMDNHIEQWHDE